MGCLSSPIIATVLNGCYERLAPLFLLDKPPVNSEPDGRQWSD